MQITNAENGPVQCVCITTDELLYLDVDTNANVTRDKALGVIYTKLCGLWLRCCILISLITWCELFMELKQGSYFSGLTKFPDFSLTLPVFFAIFPVFF